MKSVTKSSGVMFALALLLAGTALNAGTAAATSLAAPLKTTSSWETDKELKLMVDVNIDAERGVGSVDAKARLALDYEETGTLSLGKKKVEIKPTRKDGESRIVIDVFDDRGNLAYHSVVPFHGMAEVKAKLEPHTGIHRVNVHVLELAM